MNEFPDFNEHGDLPPGIYQGTLEEVMTRFGRETPQRLIMAQRLERIHSLAIETGHLLAA